MKTVLTAALAGCLCLCSFAAMAKDGVLTNTLKQHSGKKVVVVLQSGTEISGKVASVGDALTLTELGGKEFYDAVIDLDDISAVQYRAREN